MSLIATPSGLPGHSMKLSVAVDSTKGHDRGEKFQTGAPATVTLAYTGKYCSTARTRDAPRLERERGVVCKLDVLTRAGGGYRLPKGLELGARSTSEHIQIGR